ncbi:MAG: hypothetical protein AAGE52_18730 [Myxococcota bacterium]
MIRITAIALLLGCGAKTGLPVPEPGDAGVDAVDARVIDIGPDSFVPPPPPDVCVELPPEEPPEFVDVSFLARIATADVLFLVDVTGSMNEEIEQIQATLRDQIAPALATAVDDVHIAVAEFADFPVSPYGDDRDVPFRLVQQSTGDLSEAQRGVGRLRRLSGSDVPESHTEALFQAASGAGLGSFVPPRRCPADTVGYPCFRATGSRIILLFTDAEFHNGPGGSAPYTEPPIRPRPTTYEMAVDALNGIGAKVLGLYSGGDFGGALAVQNLQQIARDTGAVSETGEPIWVDIGTAGERLDTGVIDVVRTLVEETPIDIDAIAEDWPFDELDALEFVEEITTTGATPADGALDLGDRYESVRPGTRVRFRVSLANDRIERRAEPQVYYLTIVLRGDGVTRLRETTVQIVIPSIGGDGCDDVAM